jgi:hypothetical protein
MTDAPNRIAPTDAAASPKGVSNAAAVGEGAVTHSVAPRSAHPLSGAVRMMASHGRLAATAAANGDPMLRKRLLSDQRMTLLLAGLQLMDEGAAQ